MHITFTYASYYIVPSHCHHFIFSRHCDTIITSYKTKGMIAMKAEQSKFTLRIDSDLLRKFHYVAEYNARSGNRELEMLIKKHIAEFENQHGKITLD